MLKLNLQQQSLFWPPGRAEASTECPAPATRPWFQQDDNWAFKCLPGEGYVLRTLKSIYVHTDKDCGDHLALAQVHRELLQMGESDVGNSWVSQASSASAG